MRQKGELVAEIAGVAMDLSTFDSFLTEWLTPLPGEEGRSWEHWTLSAKRIAPNEWDVYWVDYTDLPMAHVTALPVGHMLTIRCYGLDLRPIDNDCPGDAMAEAAAGRIRGGLWRVGALPTETPTPTHVVEAAEGGAGDRQEKEGDEMTTRQFTVQDFTTAMDSFVAGLDPLKYTFDRKEVGTATTYVFYREGVELGRLTVMPGPKLSPRPYFNVHFTAASRGADSVSCQNNGTIPAEEQERSRDFVGLWKRATAHLDLWLGRGMWASVWEHVEPTPAEAGASRERELTVLARGKWAGDFESLEVNLLRFAEQHQQETFGKHSFRFTISDDPSPSKTGERRWMVEVYDHDKGLTTKTKEWKDKPDFEGWPFGEVEAWKIVDGLMVEVCHKDAYQDAIRAYLERLLTVLVSGGLEVIELLTPIETGAGERGEPNGASDELASLCRQLTEEEENLRLIRERKSEHVMETAIPLDLVKQERRTQGRIEELKQRIEELEQCTGDELE